MQNSPDIIREYKITQSEYDLFRSFIYDQVGINFSDEKKTLVTSRLSKRLRHLKLQNFSEYYRLIEQPEQSIERQTVIDLLTTNETYFFREPKHFLYLEKEIIPKWDKQHNLRVWSAASSSGEEAYSIAMLLDDMLADNQWEIIGSDISSRVLKTARLGHYPQARIDGIPKDFLHNYCLKGRDEYEGTLLINKKIRDRVRFLQMNLKSPIEDIGMFHIIFLRNVLIYFDLATKQKIIKFLVAKLHQGGYLFIGHSESLKGINDSLQSVNPTVYQKI